MIPGNVDPRRPDKVQRYKPAASGNGNAPGEDLTPDYMNILGPDSTTGNVQAENKVSETIKNVEAKPPPQPQQQQQQPPPQQQQQQPQARDDASKSKSEAAVAPANTTTTTSNVIPTSPQYGVAIIPTTASNDIPAEAATPATDTVTESTPKTSETENKDIHSTPSKNDRFKVVKIASSEPFRRGRWKCMDYVDQTPPVTSQQTKTTTQGSTTSVQLAPGIYMQTQSLPPHQIQQLLLQGALTAAPQFYQGNLQSQMMPPTQYFYPTGNMPQQLMNPGVIPSNSVQPQFMNPGQQQYFQPAVIPQNYQNLQFMQPAYQNQNSAFVPTTQNIQNFQQAQTYAGQPAVTQQNVVQGHSQPISATQPQPMVNGFAYSPQNVTEQQIAANNLPTQVAKNVILNANPPAVVQNQVVQSQGLPMPPNQQESQSVSQNSVPRTVPMQNQLPEQAYQLPQHMNPVLQNMNPLQNVVVLQPYDPHQANDVYTNPQFVASVHSLPIMEQNDVQMPEGAMAMEVAGGEAGGNPDDPGKMNPVVNAIDNKIEQAMDLVKSHLMYTVREEVEVLKEKIAELMERIQQLESENNFLRSQLPKNNPNSNNGNSEPSPPQ